MDTTDIPAELPKTTFTTDITVSIEAEAEQHTNLLEARRIVADEVRDSLLAAGHKVQFAIPGEALRMGAPVHVEPYLLDESPTTEGDDQ